MDISKYAHSEIDSIFKEFQASSQGLSQVEAEKRILRYGSNKIEAEEVKWWRILFRQFNSAFIYLLFGAAMLSLVLGEYPDAIIVLVFIFINGALGFAQEYNSQKSLELLKKFFVHTCRVLRDGVEISIDSQNLVPGDIVFLQAGDIVPADMKLIEPSEFQIDESILTGESKLVSKNGHALSGGNIEIYEAKNLVFSGTMVISGRGTGVVVATGLGTVIGNISKLNIETYRESSFQKGISKLSSFILKMIIVIVVLLFVISAVFKGGHSILELLLFSVALAVSVVPEALPVVTTIAFSKGAIKLAQGKVVVKRLSSIEDLGSIQILCSDKTGTLTENRLSVSSVYDLEAGKTEGAIYYATLASFVMSQNEKMYDSFDQALLRNIDTVIRNHTQHDFAKSYQKIDAVPFDPVRKRDSILFKKEDGCILVTRGAPEVLVDLSENLSAEQKTKIKEWAEKEGIMGNRVLGIAIKKINDISKCQLPEDENNLTFLGLISFTDPIKKDTKETLLLAKNLGITIKILTGDAPEVAGTVAVLVGLINDAKEVRTGRDFELLKTKEEQMDFVERFHVFARLNPEQKYKIIELLQSKYEVGFLGEGINDAPALKLANVGIVVQSASDISRESADIILLEQDLSVIIKGVRAGRSIFENVIKYIKATLISNFGNFYTIAIVSLLIPYLPMLPSQILLLNLLSDFPMIAIATDRVDQKSLRRPKTYQIREILLISIILGIVSTIFDFIFFGLFNDPTHPAILQTNWFIGSILTELALIFSIRTRLPIFKSSRPTKTLTMLSLIAAACAIILPLSHFGQRTFGFIRPETGHIVTIISIVLGYFITTECIKILYYKNKMHIDEVLSFKKFNHKMNGFFRPNSN